MDETSRPFWLLAEPGPDAGELAERIAWWRAREEALERVAPELLTTPARDRPAEAAERLETFLSVSVLRDEVHGQLARWFGPELERLKVDLETSLLSQARSFFDVRAWLPGGDELSPADLLERTSTPAQAQGLLFALFGSRRCGAGLGRYPEQLAAIAAAAPDATPLRVWDAGCGTGEGSWEVGVALAAVAERVDVLGTTPWPLERLMAERRERPFDRGATAALQAFVATCPERVSVTFADHDLGRDGPPGRFEVVLCHGVLGESLTAGPFEAALATLQAAVAPGGVLSITDRFREDVARRARERVQAALTDWARVLPGLYRAPA